ncbi:hypothetical protein WR25_11853 [Diploscapter pachys]|uniref:Large ribosomal subunit protein mL62 n=1 Tax=Diploscapter pachys TaxID=2018661 RepID=A0A2A2L1Q9_9BILA|nr:hypothetical protein WR25_11853 [Diploscapter pachys]
MLHSFRNCPVRLLVNPARFSQASSSNQPQSPQLFNGEIPTKDIEKRFTLSSGPGGQNVNKNPTKAEIRFNLAKAVWLSEELKKALSEKYASRINNQGEFIIESDRTRERHLNLADCFDKLRCSIYEVQENLYARQETEEDTEILRKRAAEAAQYRLAEKRRLSAKKQFRTASVDM